MDTPGYDIPPITGMVANGATVVCFTTGRGSVIGGKPTPVIKLTTNTPMYQRLSGDMDINWFLLTLNLLLTKGLKAEELLGEFECIICHIGSTWICETLYP